MDGCLITPRSTTFDNISRLWSRSRQWDAPVPDSDLLAVAKKESFVNI